MGQYTSTQAVSEEKIWIDNIDCDVSSATVLSSSPIVISTVESVVDIVEDPIRPLEPVADRLLETVEPSIQSKTFSLLYETDKIYFTDFYESLKRRQTEHLEKIRTDRDSAISKWQDRYPNTVVSTRELISSKIRETSTARQDVTRRTINESHGPIPPEEHQRLSRIVKEQRQVGRAARALVAFVTQGPFLGQMLTVFRQAEQEKKTEVELVAALERGEKISQFEALSHEVVGEFSNIVVFIESLISVTFRRSFDELKSIEERYFRHAERREKKMLDNFSPSIELINNLHRVSKTWLVRELAKIDVGNQERENENLDRFTSLVDRQMTILEPSTTLSLILHDKTFEEFFFGVQDEICLSDEV